MNGQDAILLAANDAGVKVKTYVPGYPITDLAAALKAEISVNEKVALEIALGASATGLRSLVLVKQVGMNILADPLVISATHTTGSGLVIIAGDDLGPRRSQIEMDSRFYGPLAELPVLDPRSPGHLYDSIQEAYALSERLRIPAIVRVTARLLAMPVPMSSAIKSLPSPGTGQVFERSIPELTMRGRHQRHHNRVLALAELASQSTALNRVQLCKDRNPSNVGIIASGFPAALAEGLGVSLLSIAYTNPLPLDLLHRFIDDHGLILVAEEPEPFIESHLGISPKVRGKLTGHLPRGLLEKTDIEGALRSLDKMPKKVPQSYETVKDRGYAGVCPECPFISLFLALRNLDVPVAGDAGCAIRAAREPFESVDVVYGLGSSVGVASGFQKKGIAVIGDYALAHSGLQALINAVWQKRQVLVVVLKNDVAAMTGGQEAPDITALLETLVPTRLLELPASEEVLERKLRVELKRSGVSVVVASGKCIRDDASTT
jgi:indolepyruvate ferredoxin oxidoreductase alpha subunit